VPGQILAMGGGGFFADPSSPLDDFILSLSPVRRPRVCFLPTPVGDSERGILAFYEAFSRRDCEVSCLKLFGMPERPAEQLRDKDVIYVSGGNTANALAVWRVQGVDRALREAWERGAVLGGVSAGANCWFESCVTDSFGAGLDGLDDGLGILSGSFCPHYDGEELRAKVEPIVATAAWVIDGTYRGKIGDIVLEGADVVVWLDLPLRVWLPRLVRRSARRVIRKEELWNGNRERWRDALHPTNSVVVYALRNYRATKRTLESELARFPVARLRTQADVDDFVRSAERAT